MVFDFFFKLWVTRKRGVQYLFEKPSKINGLRAVEKQYLHLKWKVTNKKALPLIGTSLKLW